MKLLSIFAAGMLLTGGASTVAVAQPGVAQPPVNRGAQPPANTDTTPLPGPPIRVLGPALASTTEPLTNPTQIRALPGGRVLVNDGTRRRLLMFDSTMKLIRIVADSNMNAENAYGIRAAKLIAYRGDSSLLIDTGSLSMLVIDGEGNIVKVKAIPRSDHATYIGSPSVTYGYPGFDAQGRLIYRITDALSYVLVAAGGGVMIREQPDSAPVLRLDLETRKLDTAGRVKIQKRITEPYQLASGTITTRTLSNPMPVQDDWAVMADGSIAFLRHRDYSIDWLNPDGTQTSSRPMVFDWQRLTDAHKKAFMDSILTVMAENSKRSMARYDSINAVCFNLAPGATQAIAMAAKPVQRDAPPAGRGGGGRGAAPPPPAGRGDAGPAARPAAPSCPSQAYPTAILFSTPRYVPHTALPDYKPPFAVAAARPDADNNLWIRINQMRPVPNTYLYDIVNRSGELFDRIQMPIQRTLLGFGPGNIVYTVARGAVTPPVPGQPVQPPSVKVERVRWR
jgi:hypothetical protein